MIFYHACASAHHAASAKPSLRDRIILMSATGIDILLATYNGARFLPELLASIEAQTHQQWRIICRDDGSSDASVSIVEEFANRHPGRIEIVTEGARGLGASRNFGLLIGKSAAPYAMFCDQDDVWLAHKVEATLARMREVEADLPEGAPVLIHTDLKVADYKLGVIADSFFRFQNLRPELGLTLNRLLVQNVITGNTVMINAALRELSPSVPEAAIMHDWWLGLVASAFGVIDYIEEPTILYRQHSENDTGAKRWGTAHIAAQAGNIEAMRTSIRRTTAQAAAFVETYAEQLLPEQLVMARAFATIEERSFMGRRLTLLKYGLLKNGLARNLGLFVAV